MKLSALAVVAAGATVAQVGAVPLRVIMESGPMEQGARGPIDNARFGHLVAVANGPLPVFSSEAKKIEVPHAMRHRPCGSTRSGRPPSRFHEKAIKISNVFRQALGLPLIETEGAVLFALDHGANHIHVNHGFVTILPNKPVGPDRHNPFVDFENGSPINHFIPPMGAGPFDGNIEILPVSPPYPNHRHHHHHPHHQLYRGESNSFATRLHASLMNLGPWEGRAVAFVLGCGIGVLLRLLWVLAIVSYRIMKFKRTTAEHQYIHVAMVEEHDELPSYPAEKTPVVEEEPVKAPVATEETK